MKRIHGITVLLKVSTKTEENPFGEPVKTAVWTPVENVLVGQPTTEDLPTQPEPQGRRVDYMLAIPKGDAHEWRDTEVILPDPFAGKYRTVGFPVAGIEDLIPLAWNKKVKIERIE